MTTINQPNHPIGSRLLVAWLVKDTGLRDMQHWGGIQTHETRWTENDQVGEIEVMEYSPSGKHVRVSSPGCDNYMHGSTAGWYPTMRIIVKEALMPKVKRPHDAKESNARGQPAATEPAKHDRRGPLGCADLLGADHLPEVKP